jgi:hypothetical protein
MSTSCNINPQGRPLATPRRHAWSWLLPIWLFASAIASAGQLARFSGSGGLSADTIQLSADQRFSLNAELQAAPAPDKASTDGRFTVNATLTANKALATACGPLVDLMFKNGFE